MRVDRFHARGARHVFTGCLLGALLLPSTGHGFALTGLNLVNSQGVFTGALTPSLDEAGRWDRSELEDGLSYGLQGGRIANFFSLFTFGDGTDLAGFSSALDASFGVWALEAWPGGSSPLSFNLSSLESQTAIFDFDTGESPSGANEILGNNIDLFAADINAAGLTYTFASEADVMLSNGFGFDSIGGRFPSSTILAVDIILDSGKNWNILDWQETLTHELGHALGLGDVDKARFYDTDGDPFNAMSINQAGDVRDGIPFAGLPSLTTQAANNKIVMCSGCADIPTHLTNDDRAGIRFLYPVPEPGTLSLMVLALVGLRPRILRLATGQRCRHHPNRPIDPRPDRRRRSDRPAAAGRLSPAP